MENGFGMRNVRLVRRGDIVRTAEAGDEVVRGVQIVLQLSNGSNAIFGPADEVEVIAPEELPELPH